MNDIYEEISALRTIKQGGKIIKRIKDSEVAHFTLLSANQTGGGKVICLNCGASLSLMEGKTCRFCGSALDLKKYDWVIERYGTV